MAKGARLRALVHDHHRGRVRPHSPDPARPQHPPSELRPLGGPRPGHAVTVEIANSRARHGHNSGGTLHMSRWKQTAFAASAAAVVALAAPASQAAGYFEGKTIQLIVPNTPAGAMTQYARMLAPVLTKHLGAKDVRVDN